MKTCPGNHPQSWEGLNLIFFPSLAKCPVSSAALTFTLQSLWGMENMPGRLVAGVTRCWCAESQWEKIVSLVGNDVIPVCSYCIARTFFWFSVFTFCGVQNLLTHIKDTEHVILLWCCSMPTYTQDEKYAKQNENINCMEFTTNDSKVHHIKIKWISKDAPCHVCFYCLSFKEIKYVFRLFLNHYQKLIWKKTKTRNKSSFMPTFNSML